MSNPATMRPTDRPTATDDDDFWAGVGDVLATGLKLKKIMLKRGIARCQTVCPRCGKTIQAGLVGPKKRLRMACEGQCGMNMLE